MNMQNKFKRDDLYIASIRYFNIIEEHGKVIIETSLPLARVVATKLEEDGQVVCYNVLDLEDQSRINLYKNNTKYNTSLGKINGIKALGLDDDLLRALQSGQCWFYEETLDKEIFGEEITQEELENYILDSDNYFKDRKKIAEERLQNKVQPLKMLKIIYNDNKNEKYMNDYLGKKALGLEVKPKIKRK